MGSIISTLTGSSADGELQAQQQQFQENFVLQTQQSMVDNENQTMTAIAQSHAQAASAATAGAREVGDSNAKIVA